MQDVDDRSDFGNPASERPDGAPTPGNAFRLGEWVIQPARNRIEGPQSETTVKLKAMAVLLRLADAGGQVVSREALMDAVWGDAVVTDDVLTQCIAELRRCFGEAARSPRVIETIRGVGFRLIPPVLPLTEAQAPRRRFAGVGVRWALLVVLVATGVGVSLLRGRRPHAPAGQPSIAVLPFENLSDDPDNQYIADGIAEELLDRLTRVPGLQVSAKTSAFAFRERAMDIREIGRRLGVSSVLKGSVRRSGERIRIAAQLIDVTTGRHSWSQVFERELSDIFLVQEEIAASIVDALGSSLTLRHESGPTVGTIDIGAYDLYLLGRHHLAQEETARAREFFEQAVRADPGFARAYAGVAESLLGFSETPSSFWLAENDPSGLEKAEWAIGKALELNPRLPEAYVALAALHAVNGDITAEEAALRKALDLQPEFVEALARLGANLSAQGRYRQALLAYEQATRLDPLNPAIVAAQTRLVAQVRGHEAALTAPLRLIDGGLWSPQIYEVLVSLSSDFGRYADRVKWGLRWVEAEPDRALAMAELADAFMELGEFELARAWIEEAARRSKVESFKAHARLLYASGDPDGFGRLVEEAYREDPLREGEPFMLSQTTATALYAISLGVRGEHRRAAHLLERLLNESPSLPRRPAFQTMYARAALAFSYRAMGDRARAEAIVAQSLSIADNARKQGIESYPPLTRELARAYALLGDREQALAYQIRAVAEGWRQYYLETLHVNNPVRKLLEHDERYLSTLDEITADLERMRRVVRRNGWDLTPDELFAGSGRIEEAQ